MWIYILIIVIYLGITAALNVYNILIGKIKPEDGKSEAADVVLIIGLLFWGIILLSLKK